MILFYVPDKGKIVLLKEIVNIYDGTHQTPAYKDEGVPFVSVENITDIYKYNKFISKDAYDNEFKNNHPVQGDILMTRIGDIGTPAYVSENTDMAYYVSLARLQPKNLKAKYLYYFIQTNYFQHELWKKTIHVAFPKKINKEDIGECKIILPNEKYQNKLINIMDRIEQRINTQKKIIEDLQAQKKSIINKIYTDTLCNCKLSEIITQVSIRNKNDDIDNVLSVSNKYGFIKQSDQFEDREVASDDVTNYKIVEKDIFAYNPARINVGSIAKYDLCEKGIISPMYICFKANGRLCPEYLNYYFLSSIFKRQMAKRLEGSVRQCLTYESLANIPFYLPSLEIQKKNATVIAAFISKINLENNYLKLLGNQKAYLLNKMFI